MELPDRFSSYKIPLLPVLATYVLGILLEVLVFQFLKVSLLWVSVCALLALLLLVLRRRSLVQKYPRVPQALFLSVFVFLGIAMTAQQDVRHSKDWIGYHLNQYSALSVSLSEIPKEKEKTVLLPAKINYGFKDGVWHPLSGKLLVYVYKSDNLPVFAEGQSWIIPAELIPLQHGNNPGSVNFTLKKQREGVYHQLFISVDDMTKMKTSSSSSWLGELRQHLLSQLDTFITDPQTRALSKATLLNESQDLDPNTRIAFANTGISHIIAISGMHVNLLFALLLGLLFWLRNKKHRWLKYVLLLPIVWIYIALCQFPPSAVRAGIGFTLIAFSLTLNRRQSGLHLLSLNAMIILLLNPFWLFHIGVQLSFLAVLSILIFYPVISAWVKSKNKIVRFLWSTIAVSLSVQVLVFPLVLFYFHQFPIWFLPANFLAAFFSVVQMTTSVAVMLIGVAHLDILAIYLGKFLVFITTGFNNGIGWLNQHTPDLSKTIPLDGLDFFLLLLAVVLFSIYWLRRPILSLFAGFLVLFIFVGNLIYLDLKAAKQDRIVVYSGTKQTVISRFSGKTETLLADSLNERIEQYALRPSELKHRVKNRTLSEPKNLFWKVGEKLIVFLANTDSFPSTKVDYLILNKKAQVDPEFLYSEMQPRVVILDESYPRYAAKKYSAELEQSGFKVHSVVLQGAWWYFAK